MAETHQHSAPAPIGDVVPGDPPVPITVWPVPAPHRGETMSDQLGARLVHNLTHPKELVIDLTEGPQLTRAVIAARRRSSLQTARQVGCGREAAQLIATGWPVDDGSPVEFFARCRAALRPGGCVAVLLAHDVIAPVDVIIAAKAAGLSYLQHIVAADQTPSRGRESALDIHTDVLILTNSTAETGGGR